MSISYIQRGKDEKLYQGDIFKDTIFHYLPPSILILREKNDYLEASEIEDVPNAFSNPEIIMAHAEMGKIVIISYHCNAQHKPLIQIAPILPVANLPPGQRRYCRDNKMYNYCYLPKNESVSLEESYINFQLMSFYPVALLSVSNRIVSLSEEGINYIHERLLFYFTRKKLKEISPELPLNK
jgi:hypothetical protein